MDSTQKHQYNLVRDKPDSRDVTVFFLETRAMVEKNRSYTQLPSPQKLTYKTRGYSLGVNLNIFKTK